MGRITSSRKQLQPDPRHNSLLIYQSANLVEGDPLACPSGEFRDGRFAVTAFLS